LSSVSVVSNSLLLRRFRPGKKNYVSKVAPIVMVVVFALLFLWFAKISSSMNENMAVAGGMEETAMASSQTMENIGNFIVAGDSKVNLGEGDPKLFLSEQALAGEDLKAQEGTLLLGTDQMVLGSQEAEMMMEKGLFEKPGDVINDFFGIAAMKVAGILQPTGTAIDNFHIVDAATFARLNTAANLKVIMKDGDLKFFYIVDGDNVPEPFRGTFNSGNLNPVFVSGNLYQPIMIGAKEAPMMQEEGLFSKPGDLIEDFFGTRVMVAGILPASGTVLDYFHFIPGQAQED